MSTRLSIDATGIDTTRGALLAMIRRARDVRPAWERSHESLLSSHAEAFRTQGGSRRRKWTGLGRTKRKEHDRRILQESHRLIRSLTVGHDRDHMWRPRADHALFGTLVPYAVVHQYGTGSTPARPPVAIPRGEQRKAAVFIREWITEGVNR